MRRLHRLTVTAWLAGSALASAAPGPSGATVETDVHHDVSLPLRYLVSQADPRRASVHPAYRARRTVPSGAAPEATAGASAADGASRTQALAALTTVDTLSVAGLGAGDYKYSVFMAPPDTNGAVGLTQYVQQVNSSFAVFNKTTGALVLNARRTNTLWSGFGGGCEKNNDGDGSVKYDRVINRWIISQFSVSTTPYLECIAVSKTSDATGSYYRYAFAYGPNDFVDYPKIAIWSDGYYITYNIFNGTTFVGAKACALNRTALSTGKTASQQCFQLGPSYDSLLAADLDGATPPPAGAPNYLLDLGPTGLRQWTFAVNWTTPSASKLVGPITIPVPAYNQACGGGVCIPQKGVTQKLDSLGDRLMYRLAYRNFGDHQTLTALHSVKVGTTTGVRWYEIRSPGAAPKLYQSGTYSPDGLARWMGSMAMDKIGDIAMGYSVSGAGAYPGIRYTGRVPGDPLGTLRAEKSVVAGTGSQSRALERWGDYTSMAIDPVDDCTFYYTNEYLKTTGSYNWSTWINAFKFPGCS